MLFTLSVEGLKVLFVPVPPCFSMSCAPLLAFSFLLPKLSLFSPGSCDIIVPPLPIWGFGIDLFPFNGGPFEKES